MRPYQNLIDEVQAILDKRKELLPTFSNDIERFIYEEEMEEKCNGDCGG